MFDFFRSLDPDEAFANVYDDVQREQLKGYVDALKAGKPKQLMEMVQTSFSCVN